jgi:Flp pilus assembly protein TadG
VGFRFFVPLLFANMVLLLKKNNCSNAGRRGAAIAELALALPVLLIVFAFTVDFARVYYYTQIVADCARNGAMYASHIDLREHSAFETIEEAALAGASNITPKPTVTSHIVDQANGRQMAVVTVNYRFRRMFPIFVSQEIDMASTCSMRVFPWGLDDE